MSTSADLHCLYKKNQKGIIYKFLDALPTTGFIPLPVEWQEENRYIPVETSPENYGQFSRWTVPQWIEPLNRLHPDDPCTHIAVMKSVQSAATVTILEGGVGFFTEYKLGSCLNVTASKNQASIRSSSALDPLIDNANLARLLKPISNRTGRKNKDTTYYKEFSGGVKWLSTSYNSIGDLKSNTFSLLALDELDEAAQELKGQGDTLGIIEGRTLGVRFYKILMISTSSEAGTSQIYKAYLEGDQREFFVPCPICGRPQILKMRRDDMTYGLTYNQKKDEHTGAKVLDTESVRYICKHCKGEFFEPSKQGMLEAAAKAEDSDELGWVPTWKESEYRPVDPLHTSYFGRGIYSPFLSWTRYCNEFIKTKFGKDLMALKNFRINIEGGPWERAKAKKSWEDLKARADDYTLGTAPVGPIRFYLGVDVQGDRLVSTAWGIGIGMERWLVDHKIFFGDPSNANDSCWNNLHAYALGKQFSPGLKWSHIRLVAIDCGWDPKENRDKDWDSKAHTVFQFCSRARGFYLPVRGAAELQARIPDVITSTSVSTKFGEMKRYNVNGAVLKEIIMQFIGLKSGPQSMHFPAWEETEGNRHPIADEIFRQFLSERYQQTKKDGTMGWVKFYSENHVLDASVYAFAAAHYDGAADHTEEWWTIYANSAGIPLPPPPEKSA